MAIRKPVPLVLVLLLPLQAALAQDGFEVFTDPTTGKVTFVRSAQVDSALEAYKLANDTVANDTRDAELSADPLTLAKDFLLKHGREFGLSDPGKMLSFVSVKPDYLDMQHVYFRQLHYGLPVFASSVSVHMNALKKITAVSANVAPDIFLKTIKSKIPEAQAVKAALLAAKEKHPNERGTPKVQSSVLGVFAPELFSRVQDGPASLAWEVKTVLGTRNDVFYINAESGKELFYYPLNKRITTRRVYDCSDGTCRLDYQDPSYPSYYFGRSEGQPERGPNPRPGFSIPPGGGSVGAPGTDVDEAYEVLGQIDEYVNERLFIAGANRQGGSYNNPVTVTRLSSFYPFGSVCGDFAYYAEWNNYEIRVCKWAGYHDLIAHEYGHAVTDWGGTGTYWGESGAMQESYSDIFAETFETWLRGEADWANVRHYPIHTHPAWKFLERYPLYPSGRQTKAVSPGNRPHPDRYRSPWFYCGTWDLGGVHYNSTVVSQAAALLAVGGVSNDCKIEPIGTDKIELIWLRAHDIYNPTSFNAAYNHLNQACNDLFGAGSDTCLKTEKALQAVELDQPSPCGSGTPWTPLCREPHPECSDTDNGIKPYDTGQVTISGVPRPFKDYMFNRRNFVEHHCDGNNFGRTLIRCPWGIDDGHGRCWPVIDG